MKKKNTGSFTVLLVFFFLSVSPAAFTTVEKFVDLEFYYEMASHSFIDIIFFGERKKRAAHTLAKQTVHSYLVPFR